MKTSHQLRRKQEEEKKQVETEGGKRKNTRKGFGTRRRTSQSLHERLQTENRGGNSRTTNEVLHRQWFPRKPAHLSQCDLVSGLAAIGIWSAAEDDIVPLTVTPLLCAGETRYCLNFTVKPKAEILAKEISSLIESCNYAEVAQKRNAVCFGDSENMYVFLAKGELSATESTTAVFLRAAYFLNKSARLFASVWYQATHLDVETQTGEKMEICVLDMCTQKFKLYAHRAIRSLTVYGQWLIGDMTRKTVDVDFWS